MNKYRVWITKEKSVDVYAECPSYAVFQALGGYMGYFWDIERLPNDSPEQASADAPASASAPAPAPSSAAPRFVLKSGLSKSQICEAVAAFGVDLDLPLAMKDCFFRSHRNSYWLSWDSSRNPALSYEIYFAVWAGFCRFTVTEKEHSEYYDETYSLETGRYAVPVTYLQEHNMLREKAARKGIAL